jgi:hypothetical protein
MHTKRVLVTALVAGLLNAAMLAGAAFGGEPWKLNHPRRAEVNQRLHNQDQRVKEGLKSGKLSQAEAQTLHQEDRQIRNEERADAAEHGSHITKAEQRQLNRQENAASKQIFQEKHPNAQ